MQANGGIGLEILGCYNDKRIPFIVPKSQIKSRPPLVVALESQRRVTICSERTVIVKQNTAKEMN